jgi:exodeoxyribonuclease V beta subunit
MREERGWDELKQATADQRGYRVTSYTRLKSGGFAPTGPIDFMNEATAAPVEVPDDELPGGRESGIFLHDVLEHIPLETARTATDFDAWSSMPEVQALFLRAIRRHGREARHLTSSQRQVYRAITTRLEIAGHAVGRIADAERDVREMSFLYPVAGPRNGDVRAFVKGFIDLVFERDGRTYVVDWKSDVLSDYGAASLARHVAEHYSVQGQLYSIALARMLGARDDSEHERRFGGLIFWFLRGGQCHVERPGFAQIAERERELCSIEVAR